MDDDPVVVVRKIGLASALVLSICGAFAVVVICGTVIAVYSLRIVDDKLDE